jgi:hypothetical protein
MEDSCKIGEDLDPEPAHMHVAKKVADLRSRREGAFLSLENRSAAAVSWRCLRAKQPAFVKRSRPGEKAPLQQLARQLRANAGPINSWRFPHSGIFRSHFEVLPLACNITVIYYQKVLLY